MCQKWLLVPRPIWSKKPKRVVGIEEEIKMCVVSTSVIRALFVKNTKNKNGGRITPCGICVCAVPDILTHLGEVKSSQFYLHCSISQITSCLKGLYNLYSIRHNPSSDPQLRWGGWCLLNVVTTMQIGKNTLVVAEITTDFNPILVTICLHCQIS